MLFSQKPKADCERRLKSAEDSETVTPFNASNQEVSKMSRGYAGFTLAEVLIVIGILGIIANITIPALIASSQKQIYTTQLKKAYTEFNQALSQLTNDYGCPGDIVCTGLFGTGTTNTTFGTELVKHIQTIKICGTSASLGCMPSAVNTQYDGKGLTNNFDDNSYWASSGGYKFIMANGSSVNLGSRVADCAWNNSTNVTYNLKQVCEFIFIDTNGPAKGPNYLGKDVYTFWLSNGKGAMLYPVGGKDDNNSGWWGNGHCGANGNKAGEYCAARIIEENWEMNY